jgi:DNA invertase Pin-like site-specific DNA recombinase
MSSSNGNTPSLRFAALVRVSTDRQEEQGESLRVQTAELARVVAAKGGTVAGWYGGSMHGTAGGAQGKWERAELDRLLRDAAGGLFDAVICYRTDRWSRDNAGSETGLDLFMEHGVAFYVRDRQYDLTDEDDRFALTIDVAVAQRYARSFKRRSSLSRIARAERGIPSCGKVPFGRAFPRSAHRLADPAAIKAAWSVDPQKQQLLEEIARRYLAGENLRDLAGEFGWKSLAHMRRTLKEQAGEEWVQRFSDKSLGIVGREVKTWVPPLLDAATVRAVRERMEANRSKVPGNAVNYNLLAGVLRCAHCGTVLYGQAKTSGNRERYYRHQLYGRAAACPNKGNLWIPADRMERDVLRDVLHLLKDPARIEKAVLTALPDVGQERRKQERLRGELQKTVTQRNRVIDAIADGLLSKAQAKAKLDALTEREATLRAHLAALDAVLANVPDPAAVRQWVEVVGGLPVRVTEAADGSQTLNVGGGCSWDDQRRLLEEIFAGQLPDGSRAGIFVRVTGGGRFRPKTFAYEMRGRVPFQVLAQNPRPRPRGPSRPGRRGRA